MLLTLMATVVIAGIVGCGAERCGFTASGYLPSIIICVGGALLFYFVRLMFGIGFHAAGWNAIVSPIRALIIVPFHWKRCLQCQLLR